MMVDRPGLDACAWGGDVETNPVGAGGSPLQSYSEDQSTIAKIGESLADVAQRLGVSEEALKALNPQIDGGNLQPGQEIRLPQGSKGENENSCEETLKQLSPQVDTSSRRFESDLDSFGVQYQLGAHSF